jgi:hypothetical protein
MNPKMIPTTKIMDYRNTGKSVFEKKCQYENCGNTFYPVRKDAKFCSNSCRCRYNAELKAEKNVITTNSKVIKANITEMAANPKEIKKKSNLPTLMPNTKTPEEQEREREYAEMEFRKFAAKFVTRPI